MFRNQDRTYVPKKIESLPPGFHRVTLTLLHLFPQTQTSGILFIFFLLEHKKKALYDAEIAVHDCRKS